MIFEYLAEKGREGKMDQPLWRTVQQFLRKSRVDWPNDPEVPLLGLCPENGKLASIRTEISGRDVLQWPLPGCEVSRAPGWPHGRCWWWSRLAPDVLLPWPNATPLGQCAHTRPRAATASFPHCHPSFIWPFFQSGPEALDFPKTRLQRELSSRKGRCLNALWDLDGILGPERDICGETSDISIKCGVGSNVPVLASWWWQTCTVVMDIRGWQMSLGVKSSLHWPVFKIVLISYLNYN